MSPEVIEETTNRNWVRGHSWDILDKSLAIFCWCLENFNEDDFNSNELSRLLEKKIQNRYFHFLFSCGEAHFSPQIIQFVNFLTKVRVLLCKS